MEENIKKVDMAVYILDARAPMSCINPEINNIVKNKPILYVLSKADLASPAKTKKFMDDFKAKGHHIISLNLNSSSAKGELVAKITEILQAKIQKYENKAINGLFKIMIIGVPNTGKSTLINNMAPVKKATTGDKAGVTRHTQWVRVSDSLALLDTPGTLYPSMKDEEVKLKLAFLGSIKDDVLDTTELGFELIRYLRVHNLKELESRFTGVDFSEAREDIEIYDDIGAARGCKLKGGDIDYDRLGKAMLVDFRSGRMGRITLDK